VLLDQLDDAGEVTKRAPQAIDLVHDDDIDAATFDIAQQPLQAGALQGAAGEPAVVVAIGNEQPAFVLLALDSASATTSR
jgi:hypothetical protein